MGIIILTQRAGSKLYEIVEYVKASCEDLIQIISQWCNDGLGQQLGDLAGAMSQNGQHFLLQGYYFFVKIQDRLLKQIFSKYFTVY